MMKDIKEKRDKVAKRYVKSSRHTIQVDWIPFMDEIAKQVGCKPYLGRSSNDVPWKAESLCELTS